MNKEECHINYKEKISSGKNLYKRNKGESWYYLNEKTLQAMYPNDGIKIFSDIQKKENKYADNYLIKENIKHGLHPYQNKCSKTKRVIGYIPVENENGEDGFIRIIGFAWSRLLLVIFSLVLCASIFLFGMWFANKDDIPGLDNTAVSYQIDGVENKDKDSILLPGIKVMNVKENDMHVKAVLMNPPGNGCYFKYTIVLKDSNDVLYTSGLIEPGKAVTEFDINKKMKEGRYPIKIIVQTRDISDPDIVYNGGNINAEMIVSK